MPVVGSRAEPEPGDPGMALCHATSTRLQVSTELQPHYPKPFVQWTDTNDKLKQGKQEQDICHASLLIWG